MFLLYLMNTLDSKEKNILILVHLTFKMLRLERCLEDEAAETVRGLGYSSEAYKAAKARLH